MIDDDSEDATSAIVSRWAAEDSHVHLVQRRRPQARTGKGDALNAAYHQLLSWLPEDADHERIVVVVIDADGEMEPNALEICSAEDTFGDPAVGAAQIAVWMKNRDDKKPYPNSGRFANTFARFLLRMQDLEFRTTIAAMQSLRAKTGTVGLGGTDSSRGCRFSTRSARSSANHGTELSWRITSWACTSCSPVSRSSTSTTPM